MIKLLTDIVLTITGFQLVLLALVFIMQKGGGKPAGKFLIAFLLTKAFLILRWFVFRFDVLSYNDFVYLYHVSQSAFFLLTPFLYLYIRSLCYQDFRLEKADLLHFVPFLFIIVYIVTTVTISNQASSAEQTLWHWMFVISYRKVFWSLNLLQILGYILAMFSIVNAYQQKIKNIYSSIEKINLKWLVSLLILISLHWLFVVSRAMLTVLNIGSGSLIDAIDLYSITIFLVFTTILVLKGIAQLKIFTGIEGKPKYAESKLTAAEIQRYLSQLNFYMKSEKPYLIPSLTINDLAEKLSIPSWHLSQVINDTYNQNFFNYINSFRIEEVKQHLKNSTSRRKTILEILYEAGFNSKSTFNNVFKKQTGLTPSEYMRLGIH